MKKASDTQTFTCTAPSAKKVLLAGDFTDWDQSPIGMKRNKKGVWTTQLHLNSGTYHYRFIIDDEWVDDQDCELKVPNPFGQFNSVRIVP